MWFNFGAYRMVYNFYCGKSSLFSIVLLLIVQDACIRRTQSYVHTYMRCICFTHFTKNFFIRNSSESKHNLLVLIFCSVFFFSLILISSNWFFSFCIVPIQKKNNNNFCIHIHLHCTSICLFPFNHRKRNLVFVFTFYVNILANAVSNGSDQNTNR